ncbi:MAG: rane protein [Steroidobacteraceae bacterium]|jgi:hypothetical protein|nr:rane protein [Steroidobacteraceae bacterium]
MSALGPDTENQIAQWREYLRRRAAIHGSDVAELEDHLRSQVSTLMVSGLDEQEAFLVAVKRMGSLDGLSREFAREHSDRLWKQLVVLSERSDGGSRDDHFLVVVLLAIVAALAIKLPALFGVSMDGGEEVYFRNAGVLVLPLLTGYFAWRRRLSLVALVWLALGFLVAALFANLYPFSERSDTQVLSILHLPIALWFAVGVAYVGGSWFSSTRRMDFVRFSGELFIYYVLIALGGGVLAAFTVMLFSSIGKEPDEFVGLWLVPCGAAAAVIVGSWLVEAKQSVIENMAPVLTRLFTPLFALVFLAFLVTSMWSGNPVDLRRDLLIAFDLLLILVVGLVLYSASARDPRAAPGFSDIMQLVLIASAIAVDAVALAAIAGRISEFGFTPNRIAALGENLILLLNLAGSGWFYARFLRGQGSFTDLERWQIAFLPIYCGWAACVVVGFPPMFEYR